MQRRAFSGLGQSASDAALRVTFPARFASGALQCAEHAQAVIYCTARALDASGSGRVGVLGVARELRRAYPGGHIQRWAEHEKAGRYWTVEGSVLRLNGLSQVLGSFSCELPDNDLAARFSVELLTTRQRRGAALLAAVVATGGGPRSHAFIERYARVDRKTIGAWLTDPVIRNEILWSSAQWALVE